MHRRRPGHRLDLGAGLRLLVLGGTVFLGRHVVASALARGHQVSIFNRGRSDNAVFPEAERLTGDRDGGLDALRGRTWDAVVDPTGYVPRVVRQSAELLGDCGLYVFVSSGSVYPLNALDKSEATGGLIELEDPASEAIEQEYGGLKAACERIVEGVFGTRALNVRSGLIVGPHDVSERFTYWVLRMPRGGDILGPSEPGREIQLIDVRDEADWIVTMAERGRGGTYNVSGPERRLTLGAVLESCGGGPVTWIEDEAWLLEQGLEPYSEMPLWVPAVAGALLMPIDRALAEGLRIRDLAATVAATRAWAESRPEPPAPTEAGGRVRRPGGLAPDREAALLRAWRARGA